MPQRPTRRLPVAAGAALAALAVAALGACDAHGTATQNATDAKSLPADGGTVSAAPPGKYQTLPQPCVSLGLDALKRLVPGAGDYSGTESLTYDADRRVGCRWQGRAADGTARTLGVDFERVVSYDPAVSDEVQAQLDFEEQAAVHRIPSPSPANGTTADGSSTDTGTGTGTQTGSAGTSGAATSTPATTGAAGASTLSGPSGASSQGANGGAGLSPRHLTDLGDEAFVDDVARSTARREVTVVFRTANVLVTVVYTETAAKGAGRPDSAAMQKDAQQAAALLEHTVER